MSHISEDHKSCPSLAVRAIITNQDNRILLLKRAVSDDFGDKWCLPGGSIEFGQTAEEAIAREVKEETSLNCSDIRFLFYMDSLPLNAGDKHYLILYFHCKVDGNIGLNHESSEFVFISPEDVHKYDIAFHNDEAIKKFLENQRNYKN